MSYKYDIAISFAEEDRDSAAALKEALWQLGVRTYYYPDNRADDVGQPITERLTRIYAEEAAFAVVLCSGNYYKEDKPYIETEIAAIQSRMETDPDIVYLIPVYLNNQPAPGPFDFLNKLIHLEWDQDPAEVAKVIKEIAGKVLVKEGAGTNADQVIYQYGDPTLLISGSDIHSFNQQVIRNRIVNYGGTVNLANQSVTLDGTEATDVKIAGRDIITIDLRSPTESRYTCPFCFEELEAKTYGRQSCKSCKRTFVLKNHEKDKQVVIYTTLTPEEAKEFDKLLAHISNNLRDKNYEEALRYCKEAEKVAPGEVATWKNFALTEFLLEISKDKNRRKSSDQIIRSIKLHIYKCMDHGMTDTEYDELTLDIANRLFNIEKSRIGSYQSQYTDKLNGEIWTKANLAYLEKLLRSFEISYLLSDNILFLKEYIDELSKPYKWVVKTTEGVLINTVACGYFDAVGKIRSLTEKIKKKDPEYKPPEVPEERLIIRKTEYFKINSITEKTAHA